MPGGVALCLSRYYRDTLSATPPGANLTSTPRDVCARPSLTFLPCTIACNALTRPYVRSNFTRLQCIASIWKLWGRCWVTVCVTMLWIAVCICMPSASSNNPSGSVKEHQYRSPVFGAHELLLWFSLLNSSCNQHHGSQLSANWTQCNALNKLDTKSAGSTQFKTLELSVVPLLHSGHYRESSSVWICIDPLHSRYLTYITQYSSTVYIGIAMVYLRISGWTMCEN